MISWDGEAVLERGIRHLPGWAKGEIAPSALAMLSSAYSHPAGTAAPRQYYESGKTWCSGAMIECRCERAGRTADARVLTTTATEVMHMAMEYLDMKDYGLLGRVCKSTATICRENMHYWRRIIHKFGYEHARGDRLCLCAWCSLRNRGQTHIVLDNYPPQKKEFHDIIVYFAVSFVFSLIPCTTAALGQSHCCANVISAPLCVSATRNQ